VTSARAGRPAPLHLAVALDGAGWHPAAWREADARPQRLFTAGYWTKLAQQAERGAGRVEQVVYEAGRGRVGERPRQVDRPVDDGSDDVVVALISSLGALTPSAARMSS
jgi:hypothetical protein